MSKSIAGDRRAFLAMALIFCASEIGWAAAGSAPQPGKVDDAMLKPLAEETRLNFLARRVNDLGIHLPPQQAFTFTNSNQLHDAYQRVMRHMQSREKFLADAPKQLDKRKKEIETAFGEKLAAAKDLVKQPHNQAELFVMLLSDGITAMNLGADDAAPRMMLGKRLQKLFDEDAHHQSGKGGDSDAAWLEQYQAQTEKDLFTALKGEYQKELIRIWTILFSGGHKAPTDQG